MHVISIAKKKEKILQEFWLKSSIYLIFQSETLSQIFPSVRSDRDKLYCHFY